MPDDKTNEQPQSPSAAAPVQPHPDPSAKAAVRAAKAAVPQAAVPKATSAPTTPAPAPQPLVDHTATAKAIRRIRARRLATRFALGVLFPTVLAVIYYGILATDLYESASKFVVHSADSNSASGFESLLGAVPGAASSRDALAVRDYVLSRDMLALLEKDGGFSSHYKAQGADFWTRLPASATAEETFAYYQKRVSVDYDSLSGVLALSVRAFTAEKARAFANTILKSGERMVNELSLRAREDRMKFARAEVSDAEARLAKVQKKIIELQIQEEEFNPMRSASERLSIRGELQAALAKAQTELRDITAFMSPEAPRVITAKQKVASLNAQVKKESGRLVDSQRNGLSTSIAAFEEATLEKKFAEKTLITAQEAFEIASMEAARQHRYLAVIAAPSVPDEATHPKRVLGIITVFVIAFLVFGIGSLLVAAVREHAKL